MSESDKGIIFTAFDRMFEGIVLDPTKEERRESFEAVLRQYDEGVKRVLDTACTEMERLRPLVESAYLEGFNEALHPNLEALDWECWDSSDARKALGVKPEGTP